MKEMSEKRTVDKKDLLLAAVLAIVPVGLLKYRGLDYLELSFWVVAVFIGFYLLLVNKRKLVFLLALSVPFSVMVSAGTASASLPTEPLTALLGLAFLYWAFVNNKVDRKILSHPITVLLVLDIGWMFLTSLTSTHILFSMKRVIMRAVFISGGYLMLAHFFRDPKNIARFFILFAFASCLVVFNVLFKHQHYNFNHHFIAFATKPFYADHTVYSASITFVFLVVASLAGLSYKLKFNPWLNVLLWVLSVILLGAIYHASSRASWLSLIVVAGFALMLRFKISIKGVVSILAASIFSILIFQGVIVDKMEHTDAISRDESAAVHFQSIGNISTDNSNMERLNRWKCALRMFAKKPLFGWGPGTYQFEYHQFQHREDMTWISTFHGDRGNAHSEYLTYLSETGLFGILIFLGWIFYSIHIGLRVVYHHPSAIGRALGLGLLLGLVSYYVHGVVNAFIDQDKMAILIFGAIAGLVALDIGVEKKPTT